MHKIYIISQNDKVIGAFDNFVDADSFIKNAQNRMEEYEKQQQKAGNAYSYCYFYMDELIVNKAPKLPSFLQ